VAGFARAQLFMSIDGSGHNTVPQGQSSHNTAGGIFAPKRTYYSDGAFNLSLALPNARVLSNTIFKSNGFNSNTHGEFLDVAIAWYQ
jgi:hypothetical protein